MTVTRQDIDFLVATARAAAETEIMPHFSTLTAADIKTKAHASDFVTVADVAAEELIEKRIRAAWAYIHMKKNRELYTEKELQRVERKIIAAWKHEIDPEGPPEADKKHEKADVAKRRKREEWTILTLQRDNKK